MFKLVYYLNDKFFTKCFDDFDNLYYFVSLGLISNKTFHVIKIYDLKNKEVFYES